MNIEPTTSFLTVRGPFFGGVFGSRSHHMTTDTIKALTNNCGFLRSSFLLVLPTVTMFLSVGVFLPLNLSLFSFPLSQPSHNHPTPPTTTTSAQLWPDSSSSLPRISRGTQLQSLTRSPLSFLLFPSCLALLISSHLRCENGEMLIWLCAHKSVPGHSTYLPLSLLLRLVIYCWHGLWY